VAQDPSLLVADHFVRCGGVAQRPGLAANDMQELLTPSPSLLDLEHAKPPSGADVHSCPAPLDGGRAHEGCVHGWGLQRDCGGTVAAPGGNASSRGGAKKSNPVLSLMGRCFTLPVPRPYARLPLGAIPCRSGLLLPR